MKLREMFLRSDSETEIMLSRRLLFLAGAIYMGWWFITRLILPQAFNPFLSRLLVVFLIFGFLFFSYFSDTVRRRLRYFVIAAAWLITLHYYYLFYGNEGNTNWVVGCYITVIAINLCFLTRLSLLAYSAYVLILSAALAWVLPSLQNAVFLPGLLTILVQAYMGLYSRLTVIEDLRTSHERFELLFHSTFDGILVHEGGRVLDANESLSQISGYSRKELVGSKVLNIIEPSERAAVQSRMDHLETNSYETRALRKDGSVIDIEVRAKNFLYNGEPARLVAIQDISGKKKAEKERVKALTLVENLRLRDEFLSIASHELKTPLSSLKLQTQLIEQDLKEGGSELDSPEKINEALALYNRQINRLTELVDGMLDVSRIAAGRFTMDFSEFDIAELVRQGVDMMAHENFERGGPAIQVKTMPHLLTRGDCRRLRQVIENLLSNAIKYGEQKPILVRVQGEGDRVSIEVEDHGLGIPEEFLPRVFDRFERAVSARNISGLGLGLYISKQIVDAHDGVLSVSSTLNRGSVFRVSLPRDPGPSHF